MERKKTSHKGENGHAFIIGGSEQYVGAIVLAGIAALRAGCDLATIAAPEKVAWAVHRYSPDVITTKIKGVNIYTVKNAKELVKQADRYNAVLIGPGLTRKADKFAHYFIKKSPLLKVIDADPLKSLSFKDFSNAIVTPHETELKLMLINSGKEFLLPKLDESNAKEKAEILQGNLRYFLQNNNVLVVKGATDIIISRNKIAFNRTGNQGMTKGGTGDVLAGLAVGFLAKSQDLFKSAVAAAFINGFVGDQLLKRKKGYAFIASDILDDLERMARVDATPSSSEKKSSAVASLNRNKDHSNKAKPKASHKKQNKK